jgi:cysteine synthase
VKLEAANPTGSYKDRMALAMIRRAGELAIEAGAFWTDQFDNTERVDGYRRLGGESCPGRHRPG